MSAVVVVEFSPYAKPPQSLRGLRALADSRGRVGVLCEVAGLTWPEITAAFPGHLVAIKRSGTGWLGPVTRECGDLLARAIRPWATP